MTTKEIKFNLTKILPEYNPVTNIDNDLNYDNRNAKA